MKHWPQLWQFSGYAITDFISFSSKRNTSIGHTVTQFRHPMQLFKS